MCKIINYISILRTSVSSVGFAPACKRTVITSPFPPEAAW